ncbi:MAG: hypothetical protein RR791_02705 [Lachnospiraceae bacterium]
MKKQNKRLKWAIPILFFAVLLIAVGIFCFLYYDTTVALPIHNSSEVTPIFRCNEKQIEHYEQGEWKKFTTKGVTIHSSLPGGKKVSTELYLDWFQEIADMNANVIEVADKMNPDFYKAFYMYNSKASEPLFLLQGVSLSEKEYAHMQDALTGRLEEKLTDAGCEMINILHGIGDRSYAWDVSPWVMGYLVGDKWDSKLVLYTNDVGRDDTGYKGKYCSTWENSSAFETILARVADHLFTYETGKFKTQKLLAFRNSAFTDPLIHDTTFSPGLYENLAHVNTQVISMSKYVKTGYFAAYDLNTYEPQFLSFDPAYTENQNPKGKPDAFYTYLTKLNEYHMYMPIIASTFGLPVSRGVAGVDEVSGRNGGGLSEEEQAVMLRELYTDMIEAGFEGGCLAGWQDDWSANTWNCQSVSIPNTLSNWKDVQSANQSMGILAVDSGDQDSVCYPDGTYTEWEGVAPLLEDQGIMVQTLFDETYLYFKLHIPGYVPSDQKVILPLDIAPRIGTTNDQTNQVQYDRKADFALVIQDKDTSSLMVHQRYDAYDAQHHFEETKENIYFKNTMPPENGDEFTIVRQYVRKHYFNAQHVLEPPKAFNTGALHHGNGNPSALEYDSLSDFYINGEDIEVRIPWALLNVADPPGGKRLDDFYANYGVEFRNLSEIHVGFVWQANGNGVTIKSSPISLDQWDEKPKYHFRKRLAYDSMKEIFEYVK